MTDEDDEFLNQLPDDILYDTNSFKPEPKNVIPKLNESLVTNNSKQTSNERARGDSSSLEFCINHSKVLSKQKPSLFPSLEGLNSIEKDKTFPNSSIFLSKTLREQTLQASADIMTSFKSINAPNVKNDSILEETYPSSTSLISSNSLEETIQSVNYLKRSVDDAERNVNSVKFPQHKQVLVKVTSLTKLKIKNSEWQCSASVLVQDQSLNVTFSDKVRTNK